MGAKAEGGVRAEYHHRILLALLILSWAISWPVIKIGARVINLLSTKMPGERYK